MERPRTSAVLSLAIALALTAGIRASDPLDSDVLACVPRDALGFIVVRNISQADAKFGKVLSAVGSRLPGPLALLKSIAGLDAGLDPRRDLLVVLLPPQSNSRQFHLAVWLPVKDYDALVRSLDGDPGRHIAAVTLTGEDLLVRRQANWAVVMDTDERERLEQLRVEKLSPPIQIADWSEWLQSNDAAVVVLPMGMHAAWAVAAEQGVLNPAPNPPVTRGDDLFGPGNAYSPTFGWLTLRRMIHAELVAKPELTRWAAEAEGIACGLRLDDDGNALLGLRVAISPDALAAAKAESTASVSSAAPNLHDGGPFILTGSGRVSPHWIQPLVAPYLRQQAYGLTAQFGNLVPPADLSNLCQTAELAAADVSAFSLLTRPGAGGDGIYTNNFLALQVTSSDKFLESAGKLVEEWNAMVGKIAALQSLKFDSRTIKVNGHLGYEYSIDMLAAAGGPPLPENKATMEKLFGPGGKFRIQVVAVDETTVMSAVATEPQVADVLEEIAGQGPPTLAPNEYRDTTDLFNGNSRWRVFFSPHNYTEWLRRQLDAVLGAVIGGPVVPQFPDSPPIGVAGGIDGQILWTEVAVPVDVLRGYAKFSRK